MKLHKMLRSSTALLAITIYLSSYGTTAADTQKTFHVSPSGNDNNPGTEAEPWRTIQHARNEVRKVNQEMTGDIEVIIHDGKYALSDTLVFDHRDSGTGGHKVIYKAATRQTPIISGGKIITGWKPDADGRWKAKTDIDNFRQLHINGKRAVRARSPESKGPDKRRADIGVGFVSGMEFFGEKGYRTTNAAMADWRNPSDIEFCYYTAWCHTRCKVQSIKRDGDHAIVTMLQPHFEVARTKQGRQVEIPHYIENAFELLDEPGEWYLDRAADTVYYMPRPGEDMQKIQAVVPVVEKLVELRGTIDAPVSNLHFEGITFADADWLGSSKTGLVNSQANFVNDLNNMFTSVKPFVTTVHHEAIKSPSNIVCHAARSVCFERCTFTRLAVSGIDLEHGSQDNVISGCHFYDIAGTAIQVGDVLKNDHHPSDERMTVRGNAIVNNYIHDCCIDYIGGVGIFMGYVADTIIEHNEICNLPYTGISVGWGWGELDAGGGFYHQPFYYDTPTIAKNNRMQFNHIHHVMMKLKDGGGIYTLSNMHGSIIRGNHIHDNAKLFGGIYLDEGSGFIEVTGNVVYNVVDPMHYNNRHQNRIATCNEHDNWFGKEYAKPIEELPEGARKVIEEAGLQSQYRDLLKK